MAGISKIENFVMKVNNDFVEKAEALKPELFETVVKPKCLVTIKKKDGDTVIEKTEDIQFLSEKELKKGDSLCLDFGDHQVGYVSIKMKTVGSPQDAPVYLRLKFGEMPCEITDRSEDYHGWISSAWIQEEFVHLDVLPTVLKLPRRYAFRYLEIMVLDVSLKFQVVIEDAECRAVTSANLSGVKKLSERVPDNLRRMDRISLKTLADCMQLVFEDGPKRDRRLWIGDLRLQALANYETIKNYDLVKRCMYLFAGLLQGEGRVGACLFLEPKLQVDDTFLFDYALFFIPILYDYYRETGDRKVLEELWDTAYAQIEFSMKDLKGGLVIDKGEEFWCFLDWKDGLNKQAGAQAVLIYSMKRALWIAEILEDREREKRLKEYLALCTDSAIEKLWDEDKGFFVSGPGRQVSYASQIWMILAEVFDREKNRELLRKLIEEEPEYGMVTPYMYHHFIEALIQNGEKEKALQYMIGYWGGMQEDGADTFWELYNPENKKESPYGSSMVNSYCHAWSCTPAYFIRKYFYPKEEK